MKYKLSNGNVIIADPTFIAANYPDAELVVEPELPIEEVIEPTVTSITMRQARLYLLGAGLLNQVDSFVATLSDAAKIEWEYGSTVHRTSGLVDLLAKELGLAPEAVDEMFLTASKL